MPLCTHVFLTALLLSTVAADKSLRVAFKQGERVDETVAAPHETMQCFLELKGAVKTKVRAAIHEGLTTAKCTEVNNALADFKSGTLKAIKVTFPAKGGCEVASRGKDKQYDLHVTLCYKASTAFFKCNSMLEFVSPKGEDFKSPLESAYKDALSGNFLKWKGTMQALTGYMVMDVTDVQNKAEKAMSNGAHISVIAIDSQGGSTGPVMTAIGEALKKQGVNKNDEVTESAVKCVP